MLVEPLELGDQRLHLRAACREVLQEGLHLLADIVAGILGSLGNDGVVAPPDPAAVIDVQPAMIRSAASRS